jgi:hypothetical protein
VDAGIGKLAALPRALVGHVLVVEGDPAIMRR